MYQTSYRSYSGCRPSLTHLTLDVSRHLSTPSTWRCSFCWLEGVPPTMVQLFKPLSLGRWMPLDAVGCPGDALGYLWPLGHSLYSLAAHCHTTVQNMATMGNYMPVVTATNSYQSNPTKNNQMNRPPEYHSFNVSVNFQFSNLSEQKVL